MNWWITISLYKMKSGEYFVLDIPKEMKAVGYSEECYEEDSYIFAEDELKKLDNEEYGLYRLALTPVDRNISLNELIEKAKQGTWHSFTIESFTKKY